MRDYWERRLRQHFDLTGVGCIALGRRYNYQLYKARLEALERGLGIVGWTFRNKRVFRSRMWNRILHRILSSSSSKNICRSRYNFGKYRNAKKALSFLLLCASGYLIP